MIAQKLSKANIFPICCAVLENLGVAYPCSQFSLLFSGGQQQSDHSHFHVRTLKLCLSWGQLGVVNYNRLNNGILKECQQWPLDGHLTWQKHSSRDDGTAQQPAWTTADAPWISHPITISNYHVLPIPALRRPSPMLSSKTSFSSPMSFPPLSLFSTFAVKQWFTEIAWWPFFSKRKGKWKKLRVWWEAVEERGPKCPWHLCYIFLNWWDVLRKKNTKCEGKRKKQDVCAPGKGCDSGRWACYVMSVSHLLNLPHFTQWQAVKGYLQAK